MGLYENLKEIDVLGPVASEVHRDIIKVDRKLNYDPAPVAKANTPYINTGVAWDRNCSLWESIIWRRYKMIAKGCQNCWKIGAQPKTLRELMRLFKLQRKMGLPSKCGMERRDFTSGIYVGFWYSPLAEGLGGARRLWKEIKENVQKDVGENVNVLLKRG